MNISIDIYCRSGPAPGPEPGPGPRQEPGPVGPGPSELFYLTLGTFYSWGNAAPYVVSYMRQQGYILTAQGSIATSI